MVYTEADLGSCPVCGKACQVHFVKHQAFVWCIDIICPYSGGVRESVEEAVAAHFLERERASDNDEGEDDDE